MDSIESERQGSGPGGSSRGVGGACGGQDWGVGVLGEWEEPGGAKAGVSLLISPLPASLLHPRGGCLMTVIGPFDPRTCVCVCVSLGCMMCCCPCQKLAEERGKGRGFFTDVPLSPSGSFVSAMVCLCALFVRYSVFSD